MVLSVSLVVLTVMVLSASFGSTVGGGLVGIFEGIESVEMLGGQKVTRLLFLIGYRLHSRRGGHVS